MNVRVCSRCVMDETVPRIRFDEKGICNFCKFQNLMEEEYRLDNPQTRQRLDAIYAKAKKQGKGKAYDCIVGISGGRDSTYLLYYLTREIGLRCLAVHFNDGFGNPTAGENMHKSVKKLNVDLRTISADWRESKDLKIACLKASTPDLNLATDIGLTAALYGVASSEFIQTVFVGHSFRTEGVAPLEWNYLAGLYLKAIQERFGVTPLRKWRPNDPGFHLNWNHLLYYSVFRRIRLVTPFYFIPYVRKDVDIVLKRELDWVNPGAHYFDDLYQALLTRVIRTKFCIDRRKFNYSDCGGVRGGGSESY